MGLILDKSTPLRAEIDTSSNHAQLVDPVGNYVDGVRGHGDGCDGKSLCDGQECACEGEEKEGRRQTGVGAWGSLHARLSIRILD